MHDNDHRRARKHPAAQADSVREEQAIFLPHTDMATFAGYGRSLPSRGDAVLVHHAVGVVDRLSDLIADAVRLSDDDRAAALDRILQKAEALLALAQADGDTARATSEPVRSATAIQTRSTS